MSVHFVHQLDDLRRRSLRMASLVEDIVQEGCDALERGDASLARRVIARDNDVDTEEVAVETEVIRMLALYQPVGSDLRLLCTILKVNNDLERISDCAVNIAERAAMLDPRAARLNPPELNRLGALVRRMLRDSVQAYATEDLQSAKDLLIRDDAIDALYRQLIQRTLSAEKSNSPETARVFELLTVAKNLERIADHATNIAEDVVFLATGKIIRHGGNEAT